MLTHLPSTDELVAERCRRDLRVLTREAWPIIEPAAPFVHGWHLDCIAEHLMAQSAGELPRLIINVPPRTMKSLSVAVFWPAWEWLTAPHVRWLFASYAERLSQRDSVKMRRFIRSAGGRDDGTIFQRRGYQGVMRLLDEDPWELAADQDVKSKYENTRTGMRLATSVDGMATGEGGDRIVVDDPLNAKQARSETEREAANTWWDETMTTRFNNEQATATLVMQRLHENDLTGHLLEQGDWHHLCLPAEYEPKHQFRYPKRVTLPERTYLVQGEDGSAQSVVVPGGRVLNGDPRRKAGELLDPVRLSTKRLTEIRKGLGSYGFAGQMQQRPSPEEGGMFQRGWWRYWRQPDRDRDDNPEWLPGDWMWTRVIQSWDMRFSDHDKASTSYVVGQVWGAHGADRYLLAQIRGRLSFTQTLKAVRDLSGFRPTSAKLVERKANGAAVINTLSRKITGLIPIEPEGGKDVRAAAAQPVVEAGNVFLPATDFVPAPRGYEPTSVDVFIEEHALFPNGAHDDQVDAMSQALNWLEQNPTQMGATVVELDEPHGLATGDAPGIYGGDLYDDPL